MMLYALLLTLLSTHHHRPALSYFIHIWEKHPGVTWCDGWNSDATAEGSLDRVALKQPGVSLSFALPMLAVPEATNGGIESQQQQQ